MFTNNHKIIQHLHIHQRLQKPWQANGSWTSWSWATARIKCWYHHGCLSLFLMYRHSLGLISLPICRALPWDCKSDGWMLFQSRHTLAHLATLHHQRHQGRQQRGVSAFCEKALLQYPLGSGCYWHRAASQTIQAKTSSPSECRY